MENLILMVFVMMALSGGLFLIISVGVLVMKTVKLSFWVIIVLLTGLFSYVESLDQEQNDYRRRK